MPLTEQKQVMAGIDQLAGRAVGRAAIRYRRDVIGPLVSAINEAKSPEGALRRLGAGLLRLMNAEGLEKQLAETMTQAELIGVVSATPKEKP